MNNKKIAKNHNNLNENQKYTLLYTNDKIIKIAKIRTKYYDIIYLKEEANKGVVKRKWWKKTTTILIMIKYMKLVDLCV